MKQNRGLIFLGLLFVLFAYRGSAQEGETFPVIGQLNARQDTIFKQYLSDVELARRRLFGQNHNKEQLAEILGLYYYNPKDDEDIFQVSARCNIPYSAIATLNRISHPRLFKGPLLLPTVPGMYLPEAPQSDVEQLLAAGRNPDDGINITVPGKGSFLFLPGADFFPTERNFFLNSGFHFPLRSYRISSEYGIRPNPFNGRPQRHEGLDLAAPTGTDVYPARVGRVSETGFDPVFGNYIVIAHDENWASMYGHLSSILVERNTSVTRSTVIGKVGTTGQSTGPHLHFELRKNGTPLDPGRILFKH